MSHRSMTTVSSVMTRCFSSINLTASLFDSRVKDACFPFIVLLWLLEIYANRQSFVVLARHMERVCLKSAGKGGGKTWTVSVKFVIALRSLQCLMKDMLSTKEKLSGQFFSCSSVSVKMPPSYSSVHANVVSSSPLFFTDSSFYFW